ncbi:hypothetical protein C943_02709 [Mariniradius saccharolyticus AK6]|uniref:Uncharacterized protein n=1 Tax=Mariniradius saccharolyticus AK6 TaxID=1239962 RepID=M7X8G8_9BACT|nr:hypothetical protein C943_02709 [Mariniradius saccharolyticus AK6]
MVVVTKKKIKRRKAMSAMEPVLISGGFLFLLLAITLQLY